MNPLMQGMSVPSAPAASNTPMAAIQSVKRMMSTLRSAKNPQQALMAAASQNPMLGGVMQMIGNRNPQEVFEEQCRQHGLNPEEVIGLLR